MNPTFIVTIIINTLITEPNSCIQNLIMMEKDVQFSYVPTLFFTCTLSGRKCGNWSGAVEYAIVRTCTKIWINTLMVQ